VLFAGPLSCWNTKSLPDTLCIAGSSMTSLWHSEAASKKSVRDITRISCSVTTMKLPHIIIAALFDSFCEEVYAVAFFKVVQQQTISKVGNSIICLWADNLCVSATVKELLKSDRICQSYAQIKNGGPVFTARCYAKAVYAIMQCLSVCLSVCPSVCHVRGSRQNE